MSLEGICSLDTRVPGGASAFAPRRETGPPEGEPVVAAGGTFCRLRAGARVLLADERRGAAGAGLEALVGDRLIARARIRRLPVGGGAASALVGAAVEARARGERLGRGDLDAAGALVGTAVKAGARRQELLLV